jgi:hypothetical protein
VAPFAVPEGTLTRSIRDDGAVPLPDPLPTDLVVTVEELVKGIPGLAYSTLTEDQFDVLAEAIRDATADVEAYLGRPVMPVTRVETGRWPYGDGWDLNPGDEPSTSIEVISAVPEEDPDYHTLTGYFTVTYKVGLNVRDGGPGYPVESLRPIRRYIKAHAKNSDDVVRLWTTVTKAKGTIKNLSAEGQSVTFDKPNLGNASTKAGDLTPGSLPTMKSLDFWRLAGRRVYEGRTQTSDWPFTGRRW